VFLRSLTLRGFKSFADRTVLEFAPGVSVVVGPNGSGKSNIADAISWVLGEQGPRALRGAQMSDVVFAGSPGRQALGMAEVTLVIDNSAGLIKVPASEIEISRTIFRSGESEYRLGGRPCRLLDIHEMLSDAGLGRAQHAVVGQGQLDDVLTARPEERRQFIEEAAGIAKHRRRRERAERKLAGMEGDLHRLRDLVGELRRQLKPLEKQAELAAKHENLTVEAGALALRIAAARVRELYRERDRRRPLWERAENEEQAARAAMEGLDAAIVGLEQERAEAEAEEALAGEAHAEAQKARSEAESALRAALRWESAARDRLNAATAGAGRLVGLEDELERTRAALREVEARSGAAEAELAAAEEAYRSQERGRRELEDRHRRAGAESAARRAEAETLRRALAHAEAEQERLARTLGEIDGNLSRCAARSDALAGEVERLDARATPLGTEAAALDAERSALSLELAGLEATERGLLAQREALERRLEELSESPGSAFAKRRGERPIGVLADLFEVPRNLEPALRGALGAFADAVVYATDDEVLAETPAADGGVGLILASASVDAPRTTLPAERGLLDLVRVDPRVRGLAGSLLADHYLVANLAEAATKRRMHPHARFVTEAGVVVGRSWVRTPARAGVGTESVRREIGAIDRELAGVRRRIREGRAAVAELDERVRVLGAELDELDARITTGAEEMSSRTAEAASLRREREVVAERLRTVLGTATATRARLVTTPGAGLVDATEAAPLPPRPEPPVGLRVEVESLRRERGRLEGAVRRLSREVGEIRSDDADALRGALAAAEADRAGLEERLTAIEDGIATAITRYRAATEVARAARDRHVDVNRAWREHATSIERLRSLHDQEHRARAELEGRIADAERTLLEGHGSEPTAAVASLEEDDTVEALQRRSDLVARRLSQMGRVNLLASGELATLRDRHAFLVRELDDVKAARRDLEEVIADVDRQMAELFEAAFRDVALVFTELFAALFPGGEGRLYLTDPGDPLGSGVEVEARPGKKRVKRLSLLSGGERSLTALAFLVAIFRARPSPFYLLDEVEAALDDVNLHRFLDVLKGLSAASQVLIVTHQKRTMEMADVLYGVSMAGDGTSTVISQRLEVGERDVDREARAERGRTVIAPA
jgi:chromosome segregation protein